MYVLCSFGNDLFGRKSLSFFGSVTRLMATYNEPCEKIGSFKSTETLFGIVWPCDLEIVIANAGATGNCVRIHRKLNCFCFGSIGIRNNITVLSLSFVAFGFSHSYKNAWPSLLVALLKITFFKISCVPLLKPRGTSKFLRRINFIPSFIAKLCGGMPPGFSLFKYSTSGRNLSFMESWCNSSEEYKICVDVDGRN